MSMTRRGFFALAVAVLAAIAADDEDDDGEQPANDRAKEPQR